MLLTDTHAHLYSEQFDEDRDEMMARAIDAGVGRFFLPNIDLSSVGPMLKLSEKYSEQCFPMIGLHPCSVQNNYEEELTQIKTFLDKHKFYAIGEIGIDLYWDKTTLPLQQIAFKTQVEWAKQYNLPIVIHCRESFDEITAILDEVNDNNLSGIFHCFTGSAEQAQKVINYENFKLGIGGVATFKNSTLPEALKAISPEHLVLETDSPYLAPHPYRGKRNESAYVVNVAIKLAEIYNMPVEEIANITNRSSREIFGI